MKTSFLYMDELYSDRRTFKNATANDRPEYVALTGLLVPNGTHAEFRKRFYDAVLTALDIEPNVIPQPPEIHGSNLFPGRPDDVKYRFLEQIIRACLDLDMQVLRVGYFLNGDIRSAFKRDKNIVSLCFNGILSSIQGLLKSTEIWPVVESDHSPLQDQHFAGSIQFLDFVTSHLGKRSLTLDNNNLGEMLYCSKRSIYGSTVDLCSYLLDARFLDQSGFEITPFKRKLASIAASLGPMVIYDEIINLTFERSETGN